MNRYSSVVIKTSHTYSMHKGNMPVTETWGLKNKMIRQVHNSGLFIRDIESSLSLTQIYTFKCYFTKIIRYGTCFNLVTNISLLFLSHYGDYPLKEI
jgi:hypothetical protein